MMSRRDGELPPPVPPAGVRPGAITGRRAGRGRLHVLGAGLASGLRLCHQPQEEPAAQTEKGW